MKPEEECNDCEMAEEYLQTGYPEYCDKHQPANPSNTTEE